MFGLGALVRVMRKSYRGSHEADRLDVAIGTLEQQYLNPVLSTFTGTERFNVATRLLDATLLHRLKDRPSNAARTHIVNQYLAKFSEEYEMAKSNLASEPATRAEVVALGLALREISLTLDNEVEEFRSHIATLTTEQGKALSKAVQATRDRAEEAIARMNDELTKVSARIEHDVNASADRMLRATSRNLNDRLEGEFKSMSDAQNRVNETAAATTAAHFREMESKQIAFFASVRRRITIQSWLVAISILASVIAIAWK